MGLTFSVCAIVSVLAGYVIVAQRASPIPLLLFFLVVAYVSLDYPSDACVVILASASIGAAIGYVQKRR